VAKSTQTLDAKIREVRGTRACRKLRAQGDVPAIVYGHQQEVLAIQVSGEELEEAIRNRTRMFELHIGKAKDSVLLKEVQYDALGSDLVHADFVRVALDEAVTLEVPIQLKGTPKVEHSVLQQTLGTLEIECLPADIPDAIIVLTANMALGQSIHVREIQPPPGVKILSDPETIVAALTAAAIEEAIQAAPAAEGAGEPEVIGRKPDELGTDEAEPEPHKRD